MIKKSISFKITAALIGMILAAFLIIGTVVTVAMRNYLIRDAQETLYQEGEIIAQSYSRGGNPLMGKEGMGTGMGLRMGWLGRQLEGEYLIINRQGKILLSSVGQNLTPEEILQILSHAMDRGTPQDSLNLHGVNYVSVALPLVRNGETEAVLVLLSPVEGINTLSREFFYLFLRGFVFAGAIAVLIGIFLSKKITNPLRILQAEVDKIGERDFRRRINISTGDEVEELAHSFNHMAEQLSRYDSSQKRFLQNSSHELKTPLMSIQSYAEGIKDGVITGEDAEKGLDIIVQESQRLKKIVDELIYLTKLEATDELYHKDEVILNELLREGLERIGSLARERGIEVAMKEDGVYQLMADREKMLQAFINVLGNGIRHGKKAVNISLFGDPQKVSIWFDDDGEGLLPGKEGEIFERFYKGEKGSTGLGLSITRAIVQAHGGAVKAENRPDGGARIIMEFPLGKNF
jgi:signal transduction histidine kinase